MSTADLAQPFARFDALLGVTRLVGRRASHAELVRAVAEAIASGVGFATVAVNLHRPATDDFVVAEVCGSPGARQALLGTTTTWDTWRAVLTPEHEARGTYFVPAGSLDWAQDGNWYLPPVQARDDVEAWHPEDALVVPLQGSDGALIGIISIDEPVHGRRPVASDLDLLAAIAGHLGAALELADADAAAQSRAAALQRLARTSVTALATSDLGTALAEACEAAAEGLGFAHAEIALVEAGHLVVQHAVGSDRRLDGLPVAVVEDLLGATDVVDGCHRLPAAPDKPVECLLAGLVHPDGRLMGVLRAAEALDGPLPHPERRALLRAFADQVAGTIGSAARAAALDSEARKAAILEASLDAILTMDAEGRIVEFNPAAEATFGVAREDAVGRDMAGLIIPPELRDAHRAGFAAYLTTEQSKAVVGRRVEVPALHSDGTTFPCEIAVVRIEGDGPPTLTAYIRDITDRVAKAQALAHERDHARHLATHDRLTDLPNRDAAVERIAARLPEVAAVGGTLVAVSVRLRELHLITNSFGHAKGDKLICAVAERLVARSGASAWVAHAGGDEFLVLAEAAAPGDAAGIAQDAATALQDPFTVGHLELDVSAGIGYATLAEPGADPAGLLRCASVARQSASPTSRIPAAYDEGRDDSRRRLTLLADLRHAVERDELELHYQPLVRTTDRSIAGLEALVRWRRDGALVPPGEFIGIAETSGLIVDIGEWVVREACRQVRAWTDAGYVVPVVGVNVSPRQLPRTDLAALIGGALACYDVHPSALCVEVTESAIETGAETMVEALQAVRALGVRTALDDFGAEHSSLNRVASLPVRMIKLDRGFLARVPEDPRATGLMRGVLAVAKELGVIAVVEGVETEEQWDVVAASGADLVQGFLIARPEPADVLAARLTRA